MVLRASFVRGVIGGGGGVVAGSEVGVAASSEGGVATNWVVVDWWLCCLS